MQRGYPKRGLWARRAFVRRRATQTNRLPARPCSQTVLGALCALLVVATAGGCGERDAGSMDVNRVTAVSASSTVLSTIGSSRAIAPEIEAAFAEVAAHFDSVPVYAPTELPAGAVRAAAWWPVLEQSEPTAEDTHAPNPRVLGGTTELQGQVVLAVDSGWLLFLENFRGDLGDVSGRVVGAVNGYDAVAYELNKGVLVQWSDHGRWYGIFGRGVSIDSVVAVALNMSVYRDVTE
jgi:hypothetical protein